jgi:thiol-disulfide isomerase/thioredoxin
MFLRALVALLLVSVPISAALVSDVRAAIGANDFAKGESLIANYRKQNGVTPEMILATSWLGRGALAQNDLDKAGRYAEETRKLALAELKKRPLDSEKDLPLALGASIEVQGHVLHQRGETSEAIRFLNAELKRYYATSIRTRIQKNINLLSLEGKPAPRLDMRLYLGAKPQPLAELKGKPLLLFFWAHWCGDCKRQAPVLTRLASEFAGKGLVIVGPTQRYGYVAGGAEAPPDKETPYIDQVRTGFYGSLPMTVPVSEENFKNYGCSTTPTLVLVDRLGIVRLYHPGGMSYEELLPRVRQVAGSPTSD